MQIQKYLEKHQPVIYKTFVNSLKNDKLSHAYLISGAQGTPILEVAKYLAQSLVCDDPSPLACNNCITCLRFIDNNYSDYVFLDGSLKAISKDSVSEIESKFEKTAIERKGIMVYVVHLVENMTLEAVNSILKFLEEPKPNVFAFLTTNNENAVLPTILSRCQTLRLHLLSRKEVITEATELGIDQKDSELLSYFYNDGELIYNLINSEENKSYLTAKTALDGFLNTLVNEDKRGALYYVERNVSPFSKDKEFIHFFLDLLIEVFEDLLNVKNNKPPLLKSYATILQELSNRLSHIDKSLVEILKQRNLINLYLNVPLQLDHLVLEIMKEE